MPRLAILRDMLGDVSRYENYERQANGEYGYTEKADGSVYLGDMRRANWDDDTELYAEVPYTCYSDYSGSMVEKSNCKAFIEEFGHNDWVHPMYGGHGTAGVMVSISGLRECDEDTFDAFCDLLRGLSDYPCLDEELLCELESEGANEAWDCWVSGDYEREIERAFPDVEFDFGDSGLRTVFEGCREKANVYWYCEGSGVYMYVDVSKVVDCTVWEDIEDYIVWWVVKYHNPDGRAEHFTDEAGCAARVEELREAGCMGAYYQRA